jgi:disulfide bond formation protein DsbB
MDVETIELLAAVLSIVALTGAVALVVARLLSGASPLARELGRSVESIALWLAFAVAATATAGSLYFSEIENYVPCRLCWFQRIFMYPLTIVLLVAAIRRDRAVRYTAVPLAAIGALISAYHVGMERGWYDDSTSCSATVPCSVPWFEVGGFITLAWMAFSGFVAIIVLTLVRFPEAADDGDDVEHDVDTGSSFDPSLDPSLDSASAVSTRP